MKRFATILGIFTLFLVSFAHAQQRWTKTYGGPYNDAGQSAQQTFDGGYIVVGWKGTSTHPHLWLIKTNASGDTLWTKIYGGTGNDVGYSVQQTSDSGYIITGYTDSYGSGDGDVWIVKTDASGDTLWTQTVRTYGGGGGTGGYYGYSVQQTSDGGYIVTGMKNYAGVNTGNIYLIRTDASGDTLWTKTYGYGWGKSVQQTSDGGYIIAGELYPSNAYLIKTDASGDTLWTKTYDPGTGWYGSSVQQTTDGGYIVATSCPDPGGSGYYDAYLVKTDASGNTVWSNIYGTGYYKTSNSFGYSVRQTSDGGYIVAGITNYLDGAHDSGDVYLVKTNSQGDSLWTKSYGGTKIDWGYSVRQTSDGGYIVAGETASFGAGGYDVYLIKTDANGSAGVEEKKAPVSTVSRLPYRVLPDPFTSFATVPGHEGERFALFDVTGRKVGTCRGDRIGEELLPGVYFLESEVRGTKPVRIVKVR
jgi:hypothetical protein